VNKNLPKLEHEIGLCLQHDFDPYLGYLYVVVLNNSNKPVDALNIAVDTLQVKPNLWCLWHEISSMVKTKEQV
jgi:hypothetical protein